MDVASVMERSGGLTTRARIVGTTGRADFERALRKGTIISVGHGRYALPQVARDAAIAHGAGGELSLTSAALHHGWAVKTTPDLPHVTFPKHRKIPTRWRSQLVVHRCDLRIDDVTDGATSRELTLAQCLRNLPDDEALAIADSALRSGEDATLRRVVVNCATRGRAKVHRIGSAATGAAANPFESVTRAICLTIPGLHVVPQVEIRDAHVWARPDLVDAERKVVIECDSFEFHGDRRGFRKDVRRYSSLVAAGWNVLRFTWEDVMLRPAWVRDLIIRTIGVDERTLPETSWHLVT